MTVHLPQASVAVLSHDLPRGGPDDGDDIPLDIVEIVEQHGPVGETHALAGAVVEEPHNAVPGLLRQNLAAVEEKFRGGAVRRLGRSDAVSVVLIAVGVAAIGNFPQLPAHPGVAGAVVGEHVADAVVGDGLAVVLGQQVRPAAVAVGVGLGLQNVAQGTGCIGVPLYGFLSNNFPNMENKRIFQSVSNVTCCRNALVHLCKLGRTRI